jgi:hypothetical protein
MQVAFGGLGVLLAFVYWIASLTTTPELHLHPAKRICMASSKWLAALLTQSDCLSLIYQEPSSLLLQTSSLQLLGTSRTIQRVTRWLTILAYSIGDVVIIWDEPKSLSLFGLGHAAFVVSTSSEDLIPGFLWMLCNFLPGPTANCTPGRAKAEAAMYWIGLSHACATALTLVVLMFWVLRNGWQGIGAYAVYMYLLAMALFVGLSYGYYGVVLFVVSDVIIGFRIRKLHALSYPLYYASLIHFTLVQNIA